MDKYDIAIEFLKKNPDKLKDSWYLRIPETECLFQYLTMDGKKCESVPDPDDEFSLEDIHMLHSGGLTECHNTELDFYPICNGEADLDLLDMIQDDKDIPNGLLTLKIENLLALAFWQRLIDKRWGRDGIEKLSEEDHGFYPKERVNEEYNPKDDPFLAYNEEDEYDEENMFEGEDDMFGKL